MPSTVDRFTWPGASPQDWSTTRSRQARPPARTPPGIDYDLVIVDEAHSVKNRATAGGMRSTTRRAAKNCGRDCRRAVAPDDAADAGGEQPSRPAVWPPQRGRRKRGRWSRRGRPGAGTCVGASASTTRYWKTPIFHALTNVTGTRVATRRRRQHHARSAVARTTQRPATAIRPPYRPECSGHLGPGDATRGQPQQADAQEGARRQRRHSR